MKRHLAAILLAPLAVAIALAVGGCSEPAQPTSDAPAVEPGPTKTGTPELERIPGATPTDEAREEIYEKPQLVYYRINEH